MTLKTTPVVLAHGFARFDALWNPAAQWVERQFPGKLSRWLDGFHYFRNIKTAIEAAGYKVFHSDVPFGASVLERASALADNVDRFSWSRSGGIRKVHIIAHSMGGLDARYAIAKLGLDSRVETLSTIGSPHLGTRFADWGLKTGPGNGVIAALKPFISIEGLRDLTTEAVALFNKENEAREARNKVTYRVYAGAERLAEVFTPLRESWKIIAAAEGENDGLVSITSQLWQPLIGAKPVFRQRIPFPVDHFNECGWWDSREPEKQQAFEQRVKDFYLEILR